MFATDFPHIECEWPHTKPLVEEIYADVPEPEKRKIWAGNAVAFFKLGSRLSDLAAAAGDRFEMALGVDSKAQHQMAGAGRGEFAQPGDGGGGRTGKTGLPCAHHRRGLAVVPLHEGVESLLGARPVLIDRKCQIGGADKSGGVAAGVAGGLQHLSPPLAPESGAGIVREPAVEMPPDPFERGRGRSRGPDRRAAGTRRDRCENPARDGPAPLPV